MLYDPHIAAFYTRLSKFLNLSCLTPSVDKIAYKSAPVGTVYKFAYVVTGMLEYPFRPWGERHVPTIFSFVIVKSGTRSAELEGCRQSF